MSISENLTLMQNHFNSMKQSIKTKTDYSSLSDISKFVHEYNQGNPDGELVSGFSVREKYYGSIEYANCYTPVYLSEITSGSSPKPPRYVILNSNRQVSNNYDSNLNEVYRFILVSPLEGFEFDILSYLNTSVFSSDKVVSIITSRGDGAYQTIGYYTIPSIDCTIDGAVVKMLCFIAVLTSGKKRMCVFNTNTLQCATISNNLDDLGYYTDMHVAGNTIVAGGRVVSKRDSNNNLLYDIYNGYYAFYLNGNSITTYSIGISSTLNSSSDGLDCVTYGYARIYKGSGQYHHYLSADGKLYGFSNGSYSSSNFLSITKDTYSLVVRLDKNNYKSVQDTSGCQLMLINGSLGYMSGVKTFTSLVSNVTSVGYAYEYEGFYYFSVSTSGNYPVAMYSISSSVSSISSGLAVVARFSSSGTIRPLPNAKCSGNSSTFGEHKQIFAFMYKGSGTNIQIYLRHPDDTSPTVFRNYTLNGSSALSEYYACSYVFVTRNLTTNKIIVTPLRNESVSYGVYVGNATSGSTLSMLYSSEDTDDDQSWCNFMDSSKSVFIGSCRTGSSASNSPSGAKGLLVYNLATNTITHDYSPTERGYFYNTVVACRAYTQEGDIVTFTPRIFVNDRMYQITENEDNTYTVTLLQESSPEVPSEIGYARSENDLIFFGKTLTEFNPNNTNSPRIIGTWDGNPIQPKPWSNNSFLLIPEGIRISTNAYYGVSTAIKIPTDITKPVRRLQFLYGGTLVKLGDVVLNVSSRHIQVSTNVDESGTDITVTDDFRNSQIYILHGSYGSLLSDIQKFKQLGYSSGFSLGNNGIVEWGDNLWA